MTDVSEPEDIFSPSYYLREKKLGIVIKDVGLLSTDEESSLKEIKINFDNGSVIDEGVVYYLLRGIREFPIHKGSKVFYEEVPLEIKKRGVCDWSVRRIGDFAKALEKIV